LCTITPAFGSRRGSSLMSRWRIGVLDTSVWTYHATTNGSYCGDRTAPSPDTPPFGLARLADPHPPDAPRESQPSKLRTPGVERRLGVLLFWRPASDEPHQYCGRLSSSGNLAILIAIRRASSRVRRDRISLLNEVGSRPVGQSNPNVQQHHAVTE